ncbi:MAG: hypothetical protein IJL14_03280 [Selenomonadaceae bacterium]|nr:hypothetical protein [Selenomonadaceae bacterium]
MTDQEKINAEVQTKLALQDAKFNAFVDEMREFKTEMRDRDNQRAEDMREIRTSISNMQNRIDDMGKHVRNLSVTAMAAVGGMAVAVGAMIVTVIYSIFKS